MPRSATPTLLVASAQVLGGAEQILLDAATRLDGVALACPPGPLADAAAAAGVPVLPIPAQPLAFRGGAGVRAAAARAAGAQARALRRVVEAVRPEVVAAWSLRPAFAAAPALAGLEPAPALVIQLNDFMPSAPLRAAAHAAARRAQRITAPSGAVVADFAPRGALARRTRVVPPGTDLVRFAALPLAADAPPHVLVLGAIVGWKRPELALEAAAAALPALPDLRLTVAGPVLGADGEATLARLQERAGAPDLQGRVDLRPGRHDAAALLRGTTCLLHCAPREPFGMVLVEALAAGRPVVAPDAGGPAEIADRACGRRYRAGDAAGAAAALESLLASRGTAAAAGAAGRARAAERYGADAWAARLGAVLDEARSAPR